MPKKALLSDKFSAALQIRRRARRWLALNYKKKIDKLMEQLTIGIISALAGSAATEALRNIPLEFINLKIGKRNPKETIIALSIIQSGKLILLSKRKNCPLGLNWCFPAAKIEEHQTIKSKMISRYKEKYNVDVKPVKFLGKAEFNPNFGPYKRYYYHCKYIGGELKNLDTEENEDLRWVYCESVAGLVNRPVELSMQKKLLEIKRQKQ